MTRLRAIAVLCAPFLVGCTGMIGVRQADDAGGAVPIDGATPPTEGGPGADAAPGPADAAAPGPVDAAAPGPADAAAPAPEAAAADGSAAVDSGPAPDGSVLVPDGGAPSPADLFLNPFNKDSAHHRPIGAGAAYGIPGGAEFKTFAASDPHYTAPGPLDDRSELAARIGQFICGKSNQGRKWIYRVSATDPERTIVITDGPPVTIGMPPGDTTPGGGGAYYPPVPSDGGDFTIGFYRRNGGTADILDMFTGFDYAGSRASDHGSYPLAGLDTGEQPGYYKSAAHLRWPGTVLRGHEINATDPGPIHHALNCTATRHSAPASAHILNRQVVWPAWGVDATANENSARFDPSHNHGFLPYGTRLAVRLSDWNTVRNLVPAANQRGRAMVDVLTFYGVYVVDGHGEAAASNPSQGKLQLRIDGLVGKDPSGRDIPGVVDDINEALGIILPYLYPVRNPRPHDTNGNERHTNGLCYAGGGGPLDPSHPEWSRNTAYDAPAAGY